MIELKELDARIAEIRYSRDQSPDDCIYLASLYTIRDHLFPRDTETEPNGYSLASAPAEAPAVEPAPFDRYGDSDFLRAVQGKNGAEAWRIVDRLMEDLHVINPRVYESVMRKIKAL